MQKTVCTYAVGAEKYRVMAINMLLSVRENAARSVDRYVVFTDSLQWRCVPDWMELVLLDCDVSRDRLVNWSIKPLVLSHRSVENDLLLYIDADTTVYRDIIGQCFRWIQEHSLLVYMDFIGPDERWGRVNLESVYQRAGYEARNLKINSGVIGRAPDALGRTMQRLYKELFAEGRLKEFFEDAMYKKNDEPYLGLAVQLAYRELGIPTAERLHDLSVRDYAITIAADPRLFRVTPGPVIRVSWYPVDIICPSIVHWVSSTQYLHYRSILWSGLHRAGLLKHWLPVLLVDEINVLAGRVRRKLKALWGRLRR